MSISITDHEALRVIVYVKDKYVPKQRDLNCRCYNSVFKKVHMIHEGQFLSPLLCDRSKD